MPLNIRKCEQAGIRQKMWQKKDKEQNMDWIYANNNHSTIVNEKDGVV